MDVAIASAQPATPPWPLPAAQAVAHLKRMRLFSAREALERLSTLADTGRILWLYRKYFPREYARSTASPEIPVSSDGETGYSEKEKEFLSLVDQRLFPLPDFFDDTRYDMVPIYPQGISWDEDLEYLTLPIQAAMTLFMDESWTHWHEWLPSNLRPRTGPLDWTKFERQCRRAGGLKARLPLLAQFVSHNTGNLWLDVDWESGVQDFTWKEEDIQWLIKEWRSAKRFMRKLDPLLTRMEQHPRYWLAQLVRFWNAGLKTEENRALSLNRSI
jgi:hypothetical protein